MAVVARMRVFSVEAFQWGAKLKMQAVCAADDPHDEEIKAFFEATPSASFEASIKNDVAAEQFQPGDQFYLKLERVE